MSMANTIPRMAGVDGAECGFELGVCPTPVEAVLSGEVEVDSGPVPMVEELTTWL